MTRYSYFLSKNIYRLLLPLLVVPAIIVLLSSDITAAIVIESSNKPTNDQQEYVLSRRNVLETTGKSVAMASVIATRRSSLLFGFTGLCTSSSLPVRAVTAAPNTIDTSSDRLLFPSKNLPLSPFKDMKVGGSKQTLKIPRVGFSLYKTSADQIEEGIKCALAAGVRHFDVATQYGTNELVGNVLKEYIATGMGIEKSPKTPQERRKELFITHKVSNMEQSTDSVAVEEAVLVAQEQLLGRATSKNNINSNQQSSYLDLVMVHSPLTDKERRLVTYSALLGMQKKKQIKAVGVCHYGIDPLQEIIDAGLTPPSIIQLVLSPFNQHKEIQSWANKYDSILCCTAWSKLSSTTGPVVGWTVLADIAKRKKMTNAQVLVRWSIQNNFICVPRSGSKSNIERQNIIENSWDGVQDFILSDEEMNILNNLDERYPVGKLSISPGDGWDKSQIITDDPLHWDPTTIKV